MEKFKKAGAMIIVLAIVFTSLLVLVSPTRAFTGLCPETVEEALALFELAVSADRLTRHSQGGCGWVIAYGAVIDHVFVPRYFRIDLPNGDSIYGPLVLEDSLEVASLWLVEAPYPEPNFYVGYTPESPLAGEVLTIILGGDTIPDIVTSLTWNFGDGNTENLPLPAALNVEHLYALSGAYDVYAELNNAYGEAVYVTSLVTISVAAETTPTPTPTPTPEPGVFETFLPIVLLQVPETQHVLLLDTPLKGQCPEHPEEYFGGRSNPGGVAGYPEDWVKIETQGESCGFTKPEQYITEDYYFTLQPGVVVNTSEGERNQPGYYTQGENFPQGQLSVWVLEWWE